MYVWKMTPEYEMKERKYQRSKLPSDDMFSDRILWTAAGGGTDYHFMRSEFGCSEDYKCVEQYYNAQAIELSKRMAEKGKGDPIMPVKVVPDNEMRGKPSLCLCKPRTKDELKRDKCPCK